MKKKSFSQITPFKIYNYIKYKVQSMNDVHYIVTV